MRAVPLAQVLSLKASLGQLLQGVAKTWNLAVTCVEEGQAGANSQFLMLSDSGSLVEHEAQI